MVKTTTDSLCLRPYRADEFEAACAVRGLTTPESIARFRPRFDQSGTWVDHYLHLAIDVAGSLAGDMQFRSCDKTMPDGTIEFGLELTPDLRGQGYGTQAVIAAAEFAFNAGCHRISGSTDESNLAMRRAFEKAGWHFEGILRNFFVDDGIPHHYCSYSRTQFDSP